MPMPAIKAHTIARINSMMIGLWPRTIMTTTIRNTISSAMPVPSPIVVLLPNV